MNQIHELIFNKNDIKDASALTTYQILIRSVVFLKLSKLFVAVGFRINFFFKYLASSRYLDKEVVIFRGQNRTFF